MRFDSVRKCLKRKEDFSPGVRLQKHPPVHSWNQLELPVESNSLIRKQIPDFEEVVKIDHFMFWEACIVEQIVVGKSLAEGSPTAPNRSPLPLKQASVFDTTGYEDAP